MWTRAFWLAVTERAVKTCAQALVAALIGAGTGLLDTNWVGVLSLAGMATLISALSSIGSNAVTKTGPSITDAEQVVPPDGTMTVGGRRRR